MLGQRLGRGALAVGLGAVFWANFPVRFLMASSSKEMSLAWLKGAQLQRIPSGEAFDEATRLSQAAERFSGVPLYAVIHEKLGYNEFLPFFTGGAGVFLDPEKKFYGPSERWMGLVKGFLRPSVWRNVWNVRKTGTEGNMDGEGRLLGGVYVFGPGDKGVVFQHLEGEWGDTANVEDVVKATADLKV